MNVRVTKRERGLIKGALRRVFARSELRQQVLGTADVKHSDPKRPRVKKWSKCPSCLNLIPKYLMIVDHIEPVIPTHTSFEDMPLDTVIDRMWCEANGLQPLCESCHAVKTSAEREERKLNKKGKPNVKRKSSPRTSKANRKRIASRSSKSRAIRST